MHTRTPPLSLQLRTSKFTFPVVNFEACPALACSLLSTPPIVLSRESQGDGSAGTSGEETGSPGVGARPRPHGHLGPSAPGFPWTLSSAHCLSPSPKLTPITPPRHPPAGPLPLSSLQGLVPAHPSSLGLRDVSSSRDSLPLRSAGVLTSTLHPPSHSSPISFSLTLGGKLAIYGAPSDSGGAMRPQRQKSDRRALRGVTRARSLPDPGDGGEGRGRWRQPLPTAPGELRKASGQTTESNTDNRPRSLPRANGPRRFLRRRRLQNRHWRQNGGRRGR